MKRTMCFVLSALLLFAVCVCSSNHTQLKIDDAEKLLIMSGSTGETVELTDTNTLEKITQNITGLSFEKMGKVESDGWYYNLRWYDSSDALLMNLSISDTNGYQIIYNGHYYIVAADLCIDMEAIENAFNQG